MISEDLEFQISQYADGTLPGEEAAALESTLASDAEARALVEAYRKVDVLLKRELPLPQMNWDRLAGHISAAVAQEEVAANDANRSYRIAWPVWSRLAIAAMVLLAVGLAAFMHLRPRADQIARLPNAPTVPPIILVTGPEPQRGGGAVIEIVSIAPSAVAQSSYRPADGVVYRPPRVVIASGQFDRQDSGRLPF
ncbi:MAG: hypothetical protein ABIP55_01270 [Tepidisphaeraceae bacterium]